MTKPILHSFALRIVKPISNRIKRQTSATKISRLCICTVIEDNGEFKAMIPIYNEPDFPNQDQLCISFTENTLSLDGKEWLFSKEKDKDNHYIALYRKIHERFFNHIYADRYNALRPKLQLAGWIIKKEGRLLFEMKDLYSFFPDKEPLIYCNIEIGTSLFKTKEENV